MAEDLLEIDPPEAHKGRRGIHRAAAKARVERRQEALPQIPIGRLERANVRGPQLIDEAILQRAVHALAAATRLRGKADDVFNAETGKRAADLRQAAAVRRAARRRRIHRPPGAVGVDGARNPLLRE